MFSLIISIVSVALIVAVVALSSLYMGSSVTDAQAKADAARLANEEGQIIGAVEMFNSVNGRWPTDLNELVATGFLSSVPKGQTLQAALPSELSFISAAFAQSVEPGWVTLTPGQPAYTTSHAVPAETCAEYNQTARGDNGILSRPYAGLKTQCYGPVGGLKVLIGKWTASTPMTSTVVGETVVEGGLPPASSPLWVKQPAGDIKVPVNQEADAAGLAYAGSGTFSAWVGETVNQTFTVSNTGAGPLNGLRLAVTGAAYRLASSTCGSSLAGGASCSAEVAYQPAQAIGSLTHAGSLRIESTNAGSQQAALQGTAQWGQASLTPSVSFGKSALNVSTASRPLVLANNSQGYVQVGDITPTSGDFAQTHNCPQMLTQGASCTLNVVFRPTASGVRNGSFTVETATGSLQAQASGEGEALPELAVTGSGAFGSLLFGQTGTANLALRNVGGASVTGLTSSVTGAAFSIVSNGCGATLAAGATCNVQLRYTPGNATSTTTHSGAMNFVSGNGGSPSVALSGTANWGTATLTGTLDFGSVSQDTNSTARAVTLTNNSQGTVRIEKVERSSGSTDFSHTTTCGQYLAAGANCAINVVLRPTATGLRSATYSVTTATNTLQVTASGTGIVPNTLTVVAATWGYNHGVPANNILAVTKAACDGKTSCSFNPLTIYGSDPAPGKVKFMEVDYRCGSGTNQRYTWNTSEAGSAGRLHTLTCP